MNNNLHFKKVVFKIITKMIFSIVNLTIKIKITIIVNNNQLFRAIIHKNCQILNKIYFKKQKQPNKMRLRKKMTPTFLILF